MITQRLNRRKAIYTPQSGTTAMVNYSPSKRILEVEFTGGKVYHYLHVEPKVWATYQTVLKEGGSSGQFINTIIKPFYKDVKIKDESL